jgi:protein O-mannosyl-transferase
MSEFPIKHRQKLKPLHIVVGFVMTLVIVGAIMLITPRDSRDDEAETVMPSPVNIQRFTNLMKQGNELLAQGKFKEAAKLYRQAIDEEADDADAHYNLGIALARAGEYDPAIQAYEKALELVPDYAEAHQNLANIFVKLRKYNEAQEHFDAALEFLPDSPKLYSNIGNSLARQGVLSEAMKNFTKAIELDPNFVDAHYNLGCAHLAMTNIQAALDEFNKALLIKPGYPPVLKVLNRIKMTDKSESQSQDEIGHNSLEVLE